MRLRSVITILFFSTAGFGQTNLVPNPSFEDYTACPTFASQLDRAAPWFNPNLGTPEYFNACATPGSYMSLPSGTSGHYQYPRTGNGFAGLYTFRTDVSSMREYIEVELLEPLEGDKCYYLEFYVNAPNNFPYASDGIGAYTSVGEITATNANPLSVTPQIEHPSGILITDTLGWTKVSGYFLSTGGEDHLIIGNFKSDEETNWTEFNPGVWYEQSSYLYVDDVSLTLHEFEIDLGPDTTLCGDTELILDATMDEAVYEWENGHEAPIRNISQTGEYWVNVRLGNCLDSDTVVVDFIPVPSVNLGVDQEVCDGNEIVIQANSTIDNIVWSDGSSEATLTVSDQGNYWVRADNECGSSSDTIMITVKECDCRVYIPNAFSPNNDGVNDKLKIGYDCNFSSFDFRIFNRWGEMIFQTSDPDFSWKPKFGSLEVLTYQLTYSSEDVSTGKGQKIGVLTLVK